MSDIPPTEVEVPQLPDEVISEIFYLCDTLTIVSFSATCRYWRQRITSFDFLSQISKIWKMRGCSLFTHFGFASPVITSVDWIMKIDAVTGETGYLNLPFLLTQHGWFQLIRVEMGVFCIRYSSLGRRSHLVIWNPLIQMPRVLDDPLQRSSCEGSFTYAFAHFPNSVHYAILHVFKDEPDSTAYTLSMYTSFTRNWHVRISCPLYVQRLDPSYVVASGVVYWLADREDGDQPYIVSFSLMTLTFGQIYVPPKSMSHCGCLFVRDGCLCLASNNHTFYSYNSVIWQVSDTDEGVNWSQLFTYNGIGTLYVPVVMVDHDVIQVMERHLQLVGA
ncbi:uncharacterized protein LOC110265136 [Arachis ipaensis]|uniref:F-box domain-containing protein n=1 Tax=Arachis hypogaea TaxID=3818 RepID=A0A445CAE1_ARAHY|nr:uncharacterized protein LOC110265136 [Arachis ipaensis]RYR47898.1 hypothetical protein Ahy_A07g033883 [Arachis hypogaea]